MPIISSTQHSKQSRPFGARSTDAGAGADVDVGAGATLQFYLLCLFCVSDDSDERREKTLRHERDETYIIDIR